MLKRSENSTWLGRWLTSGSAWRARLRDDPKALAVTSAPAAIPVIGPVAEVSGLNELLRVVGERDKSQRDIEDSFMDSLQQAKNTGYGESAVRGVTSHIPASVVLALLTGGGRYFLSKKPAGRERLEDAAKWALVSGVGTLGVGALAGVWDRAVVGHTSPETHRRVSKMKARHRYTTALPLGDVVGAAVQ